MPNTCLSEEQSQWFDRVSVGLSREVFERECQREDAAEVVHKALARLSPEDRVLVECIYFEELPLKEVAATLGWSLSNAKVRAFRARKKLRQIVEHLLNIE
jgi:RNA polymerase sigma-70 factor (ECF subfamily)